MKLIYKGAENRSDLEFIRLGIIRPKEAFVVGQEYEVPNELAQAILDEGSPIWEKAPTKKSKGDK